MTATTPAIKPGDTVIYAGSLTMYCGILFTVLTGNEHSNSYTLAYYHGRETIIRRTHAQSLIPVSEKDILYRTCEECGWGPYWYLRDGDTTCPVQDSH
jgi:hypothetical protein